MQSSFPAISLNSTFIQTFHSFSRVTQKFPIRNVIAVIAAAAFSSLALLHTATRRRLIYSIKTVASKIPPFKFLIPISFRYKTFFDRIEQSNQNSFETALNDTLNYLSPKNSLDVVYEALKNKEINTVPLKYQKALEKLQGETPKSVFDIVDQEVRISFDPIKAYENRTDVERRAIVVDHIASRIGAIIFSLTDRLIDVRSLIQKIEEYPRGALTRLFYFLVPISFHRLWVTLKPILESMVGSLDVIEKFYGLKITLALLFTTLIVYLLMRQENVRGVTDLAQKVKHNQVRHKGVFNHANFVKTYQEMNASLGVRPPHNGSSICLWHNEAEGSVEDVIYGLLYRSELGVGPRCNIWEIEIDSFLADCPSIDEVPVNWERLVNEIKSKGFPFLYIHNPSQLLIGKLKEDDSADSRGPESKEQALARLIKASLTDGRIRCIFSGDYATKHSLEHATTKVKNLLRFVETPYITPDELKPYIKEEFEERHDLWESITFSEQSLNGFFDVLNRFNLAPDLPEEAYEHLEDVLMKAAVERDIAPKYPFKEESSPYSMRDAIDLVQFYHRCDISLRNESLSLPFLQQLEKDLDCEEYKTTELFDEKGSLKDEVRQQYESLVRELNDIAAAQHRGNKKSWEDIKKREGYQLDQARKLKNTLIHLWRDQRRNHRTGSQPAMMEKLGQKIILLDKIIIPFLSDKVEERLKTLKGIPIKITYDQLMSKLQEHYQNILAPPTTYEEFRMKEVQRYLNKELEGRSEVVNKLMNVIKRFRYIPPSARDTKPTVIVFPGPPGGGKSKAVEILYTALQYLFEDIDKVPQSKKRLFLFSLPLYQKFGSLDLKFFDQVSYFVNGEKNEARSHRTCIVDVEEFDKVDKEKLNSFLNYLDNSQKFNPNWKDNGDRNTPYFLDLRNVIFTLTCNMGETELSGDFNKDCDIAKKYMISQFGEALFDRLSPDKDAPTIIPFGPIQSVNIESWIYKYLEKHTKVLKERKCLVKYDTSFIDYLKSHAEKNKNALRSLEEHTANLITKAYDLMKMPKIPLEKYQPWEATLIIERGELKVETKNL
ncbi:MAG: hypothetical protein Tsb0021_06820 [Chlamydiales bacterium]